MSLILGIETSCDETGASIFDLDNQKIKSSALFSQIKLHEVYGGVVPEIASRSQLEKIDLVVQQAITEGGVSFNDIKTIAVTNKPGLAGSLLIGVCFAKALAWGKQKKLIGVDHIEGHIFSPFLKQDFLIEKNIPFPHLSLTASGGHTSLHLVKNFGKYEMIGETLDDAAGEAFDKIAKILGLGYPGGAAIEKRSAEVGFKDFFSYPRNKNKNTMMFSFSGLKTAVLYSLVKMGAYDLRSGPIKGKITLELQQKVSSSLLVCIADIFEKNIKFAFKQFPSIMALTFGGGVACNKYINQRLSVLCSQHQKQFYSPPKHFCTDNGAMIAFVGGYKFKQNLFSDTNLDVERYTSNR
jgi:N6-L-threonylcarbamoyladenine synthase